MLIESIWLTKLILAHLLTDFVLQPRAWVEDRLARHYASGWLYVHTLLTAGVAWIMIGIQYWPIAIIIFLTHTLIDIWKSYRKQNATYFIADQLLHLIVIGACWYFSFIHWSDVQTAWAAFNKKTSAWKIVAGIVFLTTPAGILIGQLTRKWRDKIPDSQNLADAGKWIGIVERLIILILVLHDQYAAMGLLVAAKGIIRFSEKDRPEIKTEYLVIGTLMSIGLAIATGLAIQW